jgi:uncharacterized protein (TIGR02391 family)
MVNWYVSVRRLIREIEKKSRDALSLYRNGGKEASAAVNAYLKSDLDRLSELWAQQFDSGLPSNLARHIRFGTDGDYCDIVNFDLLEIEKRAEERLLEHAKVVGQHGFENLLHPAIQRSSYRLFCDGHLREAVLNSVVAVFDYLREVTGIAADGDALIGQAFSMSDPYVVLSELGSESGKNDQKGFMQIFKGAYQGIRNPKAHSLTHDLTPLKAAQYLVFASLLARRLDEARILKKDS